jgi:glycosyltransferase involved in cell wall biosynthesis
VPSTPGVDYRIIYSSLEFSGLKAEIQNPKKLLITHVGRIARGKGQIDAVKASAKLDDAGIDFSLELLGGVEDEAVEKELKSEINKLGLSARVNLRGHVDNVSQILSYTDVFLFPSAGEGMPNAFIEALHYGVPCLAYSNTVFPEFIEMGFHVHLVKDSDVAALSSELTQIVANLDKEKQLSKNNVALCENYFSVDRELDGWREVICY